MWLMTPRGFYSAVQKKHQKGTPRITVRARSRQDLENLRDLLPGIEPVRGERWNDYPWRIEITIADWTKAVSLMALEIDYDNFKDEVKARQGRARASTYTSIWSVLRRIHSERHADAAAYPSAEDISLLGSRR